MLLIVIHKQEKKRKKTCRLIAERFIFLLKFDAHAFKLIVHLNSYLHAS